MKTVYKALDEVLGIEVAWNQVKLVGCLQTPEDLQRLYSEVHLLATLDHESIIRFYTSWIDVDNTTFNFVTEMFTSGTLREYRAKYKRVNIRAIKIWARQILQGLVYLHSHDPLVIHRDLKCDNIFVNGHLGQVKIGDLGLAAILHGSNRAHSVIGTPEFMAPELFEESYNQLVDIYSYGMCVLEMTTSEYPYSECTNPAQIYKKVISGKKPRAFYKVQDLDAQRFIGKCLETVSKRLSAKELMLDPFLVVDHFDDEGLELSIDNQKPFLNEKIELEHLHLNDNDNDNAPRTNMTITGKLNPEDGTIFLKVQIADKQGDVRNVFFPFDIVTDTPIDVANEMVKELEINDWRPLEIANMIDSEISGLVPDWKAEHPHVLSYQEDDYDQQNLFSPSSSSQVSVLGSILSHRMDTKGSHWLHGEMFDDTSSQSSSQSEKYSNWAYEEPENTQSPSRFYPGENAATKQVIPRASTSKTPRLTRNKSLVDTRSQSLHRSLVEEVNRRRLFKTVGSVENIGFQSPFEVAKPRLRRRV